MEPTAEREASAGQIVKELLEAGRQWLGLELRAAGEEVRDEASEAAKSAAVGGLSLMLGVAGLAVIAAGVARILARHSPATTALTGFGLLSLSAGGFAMAAHVAPTDAPKRLAHLAKEEAEAIKESMK